MSVPPPPLRSHPYAALAAAPGLLFSGCLPLTLVHPCIHSRGCRPARRPAVFKMIWAFVRPMLDVRTQNKIEVRRRLGGPCGCLRVGGAPGGDTPETGCWHDAVTALLTLLACGHGPPSHPLAHPLSTHPPHHHPDPEQLAPSDYMKVLLKYVDIENIPEYLGGG